MNEDIRKMINKVKYLNESVNDSYYTLYHGTSSGKLDNLKSKKSYIYATTEEDVAYYYAAKGGENYFLKKEEEFEKQRGITPDEYYDTEENGELPMFKALYPKNETPIVIKLQIPKDKIKSINDFIGYKGGELFIEPNYISEVINVDWNDLDY